MVRVPAALAAMRAARRRVLAVSRRQRPRAQAGAGAASRRAGRCITVGNGSNELLLLLAESFLGPQCSAVCSQYGFAIYPLVIRATGARCIEVAPLAAQRDRHALRARSRAMARAPTADTRLVFVANPNNPTGTWVDGARAALLHRGAPADALVVLDEAYVEYADAERLPRTGCRGSPSIPIS